MDEKERFKIEYNTVNNYILHYSNVRSALASLLVTVALASFGGYYRHEATAISIRSHSSE